VGAVELARQARALNVAVRPEQAHDVRAGALKCHVAHHLQCMIIHECWIAKDRRNLRSEALHWCPSLHNPAKGSEQECRICCFGGRGAAAWLPCEMRALAWWRWPCRRRAWEPWRRPPAAAFAGSAAPAACARPAPSPTLATASLLSAAQEADKHSQVSDCGRPAPSPAQFHDVMHDV